MTFENLSQLVIKQFEQMSKHKLFVVDISGDELWNLYIRSFKKEDDPIFRDPNSTSHTCNNDKNFIRRYGNIVAVIENKMVTMWDLDLPTDNIYYRSCKAMSKRLKAKNISNVFIESFSWLNVANYEKSNKNALFFRLGVEKVFKQYTKDEVEKFGVVQENKVYTFHHFHVYLPKEFVDFSNKSIESILGELKTTRQLFEKGLNIPLDTLELVRDLINQGSLLRGDMYLPKVLEFIKLKKDFEKINQQDREQWMWDNFRSVPFARFANELIGTTCIELAEGKDINKVCKDFNVRVDPANYNKAKSPITKAMIDIAEKEINDLGYQNSFNRRFAKIDDIDVSEIKHTNLDNTKDKPIGLFEASGAKAVVPTRHKRSEFNKVQTVTIDTFMKDILPSATSIELYLENRMENNLVSLFTTENSSAKNLFKWNNPFSWTYNGNLSGKSMIKENVKAAGGKVEGALRCSLQWNDEDTKGIVDLDLHCNIDNGGHIYYGDKYDRATGGTLDIDMISPSGIGVENITWSDIPRDGKYTFFVRNFNRARSSGFKVEIEFEGNVFNYHYPEFTQDDVKIAVITIKQGVISIQHLLPEQSSSKALWGLDSNEFHKVNLVCTSPNHWGDNNIGTKEYFFMLQGCKTDLPMRTFHVDQLNSELSSVRKAIDLLGSVKLIEPANSQLSGVGFNSTVRDEVVLKVKGTHQRVIKIII